MLTVDQLRNAVQAGRIDTVILALTDMQGRLQGKRLTAHHFLDERARARRRGLQLPARGRRRDEHRRRLRDVLVGARLRRLRDACRTSTRCGWCRGTRARRCAWPTSRGPTTRRSSPRRGRSCARSSTGSPSAASRPSPAPSSSSSSSTTPTSRRSARATATSRRPTSTTSTTRCWAARASRSCCGRIRNQMGEAGLEVESSKGECNDGQHEINFRYGPALRIADEHAIYKNGAKEIAAQDELAITFMAKYDAREGSLVPHPPSLQRDGGAVRPKRAFDRFIAGQLACLRELTLLYAPNVNSYKRFAKRLVRADRGGLGPRQPHVRGARRRPRATRCGSSCACPAPTSTRTWRWRRWSRRGCTAWTRSSSSSRRVEGNAYVADKPHVPATLTEARELFAGSEVARERVRRGGRRALPQRRAGRTRGLRVGRDRLGASTGVRTAVMADSASSRRSNPPRRSRRRWSASAPRSSSGCCRPARGCRPSASCASSSASRARRCARR